MSKMQLQILTPEKLALETEASSVYLQGALGRLGILPGHTALISKLEFGLLEYEIGTAKHVLLCGAGLVEVADDRVTVLVRSAERADQIDVDRAKSSLQRAKSRLNSNDRDLEFSRAEASLERAMHRLRFTNSI